MNTVTATKDIFRFKKFHVDQTNCLMKVSTDGVLLGAWTRILASRTALDIGSGSGVIAIMLAQRSTELMQIVGVEIDENSCLQARENTTASPWADRLGMVHASVQDYARNCGQTFDLIVSNPPFFTAGTLSYNQKRNSVRHAVSLPHDDLLQVVSVLLSPAGHFSVILPVFEGTRFKEQAEGYQLYLSAETQVHGVASKPVERVLFEFARRKPDYIRRNKIVIYSEVKEFTESYKQLTKDFYLKF